MRRVRLDHALAAILLSIIVQTSLVRSSSAGDISLSGDSFTAHVKSMKERRFLRVIHQQFDFSCGSAATATLLTYGYEMPVSERQSFDVMFAKGNQAAIKKVGFSLLDMQTYFKALGLHSDGYKIGLQQIAKIGLPAITLIKPNGYNHFVVVRGLNDQDVLVADSALGLRRMPVDTFKQVWSGVVFYIKDRQALAHRHFNEAADWALAPAAPLERGMDHNREGIDSLYFSQPMPQQF